jgi:hypothetical protein
MIEAAIARFDEFVRVAASDRESFVALLSGHAKQGMSSLEQRVRKDAFRSNSHLWGHQCRTLAFLVAMRPNTAGTAMNSATVRGWVDLHTSRPQHATLLFSRFQLRHDDEGGSADVERASRAGSLDLVHGFGTIHGDSALVTIDRADGRQETHVQLPDVGREGRVTLFLRQQIEAGCLIAENARMVHVVSKPAEALLFDLLVPAGWADPEKTRALMYARPNDVSLTVERRSEDLIPCHDTPMLIPGVAGVPGTPDVPQWSELVEHVLTECGWLGERFDLIRLRVAYPMLHSAIVLDAAP